jgi:hypothetical protein
MSEDIWGLTQRCDLYHEEGSQNQGISLRRVVICESAKSFLQQCLSALGPFSCNYFSGSPADRRSRHERTALLLTRVRGFARHPKTKGVPAGTPINSRTFDHAPAERRNLPAVANSASEGTDSGSVIFCSGNTAPLLIASTSISIARSAFARI